MESTIRVRQEVPTELKADGMLTRPGDKDCVLQVAHTHPLQQSELRFHQHKLELSMQMLRNREGLHAPLKLGMELFAANQIGRLPFLQSSNFQRDVLLGRDESFEPSDFLGNQEFSEYMRQPHAVVEKHYGIL